MPVDVTDKYIRIRVRDPDDFQSGSFRTVTISESKGIKAVMGKLHGTVQSYLFDKEKWTVAEAEAWVKEHEKKKSFVLLDEPSRLRVKVQLPGLKRVKSLATAAKRLQQWDDYKQAKSLWVLGVPFGGPEMGRDADGEAFHDETNIWLEPGDEVPVTYYHGFGPDDPHDWQENPAVIGKAKLSHKTDDGWWFEVKLDVSEPLAMRIMNDPENAKASSGAISHLVRIRQSGLIDVWPVGELAVFDTNEWRQPANDYAVVITSKPGTEPEAKAKADGAEAGAVRGNGEDNLKKNMLEANKTMDEKEKETKQAEPQTEPQPEPQAPVVDVAALAEQLQPIIAQSVEANVKAILEAEPVVKKAAPAVKRITGLGFSKEPKAAFIHYLRTGDEAGVKAALQEGTDSEGGYLVPDDFLPEIIAKRDEASVMRKAGARVITTSRDVINIPTEDASQSVFAITAEEAAVDEDEPTFGQVAVTVYKFTKLVKVSEELMGDEAANLDAFIADSLGRAWAATENKYGLVGTGTSQPQGVFVGGTAALTLDSATTIGASEIPELFYKLPDPYADKAVWVMRHSTEGVIRGLQGSDFLFVPTPQGGISKELWGKPVLNSDQVAAIATGAKTLLIGNFWYYALVNRQSMTVRRLNELYAATGQIGILATVRMGGAVLQAEAFQYATQL
jgi:HK97 family phage major capsid protein